MMIAQEPNSNPQKVQGTVHVFFLRNATTQAESNDLIFAIRNIVTPTVHVVLAPSQNAIVFRGSDEEFAAVSKLLTELDVPRKLYRLTYTMTDMDGGKRIGSQHYALLVAAGQRVQLREGSRVPIATQSANAGKTDEKRDITYVDVGINFDATVSEIANGIQLRSKVERSSIAEGQSPGAEDPVIRQTVIEGTSLVALNKPHVLGALDAPGSTREVDVEVIAELVK